MDCNLPGSFVHGYSPGENGLPRLPPRDLLHLGIEPVSPRAPALGEPMDCSTPGFPIHHQFLELVQTHVHGVGDAIQPSHPLSSPSPSAFNLS